MEIHKLKSVRWWQRKIAKMISAEGQLVSLAGYGQAQPRSSKGAVIRDKHAKSDLNGATITLVGWGNGAIQRFGPWRQITAPETRLIDSTAEA